MSTVTLDNKTILVTGAAGFIGSNLSETNLSGRLLLLRLLASTI